MIACAEHGWLELRAWVTEEGREYALLPPSDSPGQREGPGNRDN